MVNMVTDIINSQIEEFFWSLVSFPTTYKIITKLVTHSWLWDIKIVYCTLELEASFKVNVDFLKNLRRLNLPFWIPHSLEAKLQTSLRIS